jgi:hypothetical protein
MLFYAIRRLLVGVVQVAIIAMTTFIVLRLLPVDPTSVFAGMTADGASRAIVARQLGLDQPLTTQLGSFVANAFQGTLGRSWVTQTPVISEIKYHIGITLELVFAALIVSVILGTLLGYSIAAADSNRLQHRRQPLAALGKGIVLASGSQPEFWWGARGHAAGRAVRSDPGGHRAGRDGVLDQRPVATHRAFDSRRRLSDGRGLRGNHCGAVRHRLSARRHRGELAQSELAPSQRPELIPDCIARASNGNVT